MPCHPVIGLIPQQMYQEIARDYLEQTKQGERISKEHYHGRIIHRTGPQVGVWVVVVHESAFHGCVCVLLIVNQGAKQRRWRAAGHMFYCSVGSRLQM